MKITNLEKGTGQVATLEPKAAPSTSFASVLVRANANTQKPTSVRGNAITPSGAKTLQAAIQQSQSQVDPSEMMQPLLQNVASNQAPAASLEQDTAQEANGLGDDDD